MAGLTKAQRAERDAAKAATPADDGLVPVEKDGQTLRVHPSCLKEHRRNGWKTQEIKAAP